MALALTLILSLFPYVRVDSFLQDVYNYFRRRGVEQPGSSFGS